jgi:hypothetical protein
MTKELLFEISSEPPPDAKWSTVNPRACKIMNFHHRQTSLSLSLVPSAAAVRQ